MYADEEAEDILAGIRALGMVPLVEDVVIHNIERYIRWHVAPMFWKKFENTENSQRGFELFKSAVDDLYTSLTEFLPLLKRLEYLKQDDRDVSSTTVGDNIQAQFKLIVRATLLSQLPLCHECIVEHFYKIAFNVFCNTDNLSQGEFAKYRLVTVSIYAWRALEVPTKARNITEPCVFEQTRERRR